MRLIFIPLFLGAVFFENEPSQFMGDKVCRIYDLIGNIPDPADNVSFFLQRIFYIGRVVKRVRSSRLTVSSEQYVFGAFEKNDFLRRSPFLYPVRHAFLC